MEIVVPPQVGGWACGIAAVKKGRMARIKERERYISDCKTTPAGCREREEDCRDFRTSRMHYSRGFYTCERATGGHGNMER